MEEQLRRQNLRLSHHQKIQWGITRAGRNEACSAANLHLIGWLQVPTRAFPAVGHFIGCRIYGIDYNVLKHGGSTYWNRCLFGPILSILFTSAGFQWVHSLKCLREHQSWCRGGEKNEWQRMWGGGSRDSPTWKQHWFSQYSFCLSATTVHEIYQKLAVCSSISYVFFKSIVHPRMSFVGWRNEKEGQLERENILGGSETVELLYQGVYLEWTSPCIIYTPICHYATAKSQGDGGRGVLACFDILEVPLHPSDLDEICHWT